MGFLTEDIEISAKNLMSIILLLSITLAWFLILQTYISETVFWALEPTYNTTLSLVLNAKNIR